MEGSAGGTGDKAGAANGRPVADGLRREFDILWEETLSVLDSTDCPALDWRPAASAPSSGAAGPTVVINPVGVLARHIAGADLFWVGEMAGGRPSGRVRAAEFGEAPLPPADLLALVARSRQTVETVLSALVDDDLHEKVELPEPPRAASSHPLLQTRERPTRLFCILHALTHHAHHNGQLLLLKRLWQADRSREQ